MTIIEPFVNIQEHLDRLRSQVDCQVSYLNEDRARLLFSRDNLQRVYDAALVSISVLKDDLVIMTDSRDRLQTAYKASLQSIVILEEDAARARPVMNALMAIHSDIWSFLCTLISASYMAPAFCSPAAEGITKLMNAINVWRAKERS